MNSTRHASGGQDAVSMQIGPNYAGKRLSCETVPMRIGKCCNCTLSLFNCVKRGYNLAGVVQSESTGPEILVT